MKACSLRLLLTSFVLMVVAVPAMADPLAEGFKAPPPDARPQIWWHWRNGDITKEGITADLEAMQRAGIGGAHIFNVGLEDDPTVEERVKILSPEWHGLVQHAINEAKRLGLEIAMQNCPGWDQSGGPWVTPEHAMQWLEWTDTLVRGGRSFSGPLPQPRMIGGYYRDVAVLAFPAPPTELKTVAELAPVVTTSVPGVDGSRLLQGPNSEGITLPFPSVSQPQFVQFDFHSPQRWASVRIRGRDEASMPDWGNIEVSDDGVTFRKVGVFPTLNRARTHELMTVPFPETTARFFRIVIQKVEESASQIVIRAIDFGGERLDHSEELAGYRSNEKGQFSPSTLAAAFASTDVIDLTDQWRDERLEWNAPPGDWIVTRIGTTLTGKLVGPAPMSGRGLEVDKLSREAVTAHFEAMIGQVIAKSGPLAGTTFKTVLADSWEAGCANWTPQFREEFRRRRGYELRPWLPALSGRVIGSVEQTERFLWDYRRTLADLVAENHYGTFRELCHQHGMQFMSEAPGYGGPTIADGLQCRGQPDIPMGEFWMADRKGFDTKEAASAAHIYGAKLAAAEAFSSSGDDAQWRKAPADFKRVGDLNFTHGINLFVLHRYTHQPWPNMPPRLTSSHWGSNFERTNTWWEQAHAWTAYLTRCQFLLQRGQFVADVLYYYGEGVPTRFERNMPKVPAGHDYDVCNRDVLLTRLSVKDGRLVLPDGMSYRLLLLPESDRMTPAVLRKIRELVAAGATVVGRRPAASPSLADFPASDAEIKKITDEIWADCDGVAVKEHRHGAGRMISGRPLADVLTELGASPDFLVTGAGKFTYIHRRINGAGVYFVSSQNLDATAVKLSFRVNSRQPELWNPDTGEIVKPAVFSTADRRTTMPVRFDPAGSVFVVFRETLQTGNPIVAVERDGQDETTSTDGADASNGPDGIPRLVAPRSGVYTLRTAKGKTQQVQIDKLPAEISLTGPWELRFPAGWGAPEKSKFESLYSWTESQDEGVKYFSGTATYVKEFEIPVELASADALTLNLGTVRVIAQVRLNGKDLGVLWRPPFTVDISRIARPGKNQLEIRVTNLWPNRMIGDQRLSVDLRHTWTTFNPYTARSPLLESGLLGPVTLRPRASVPIPSE